MTSTTITPEVQEFLAAVRAQLADLDLDEQREILDGLEADLSDLVAERGGEALGDPVAYARELRAAAGLDADMVLRSGRAPRASVSAFVGGVRNVIDALRHGFDATVTRLPGDVPALLAWLRPLWWVVRGWAAVQFLDLYDGRVRANLVPDLQGTGWFLCLVAIAGSVAVGRGAVWPGGSRGLLARTVLLVANVLAVVVAPIAVGQVVDSLNERYDRGMDTGFRNGFNSAAQQAPVTRKAGIYADSKWVSNIYPYDAEGRPLVGVQLFDQTGNAIDVVTQTECVYDAAQQPLDQGRQYFPWSDGAAQKHNVFPVPSKVSGPDTPDPDPLAFTRGPKPSVGPFPFAAVPPISLPGLSTSKGVTPSSAYVEGALPGTPINPIDLGC